MQNSFQAIQITPRVYWVGAIDWALRDFHGYQTSRGSTYNAFLILGEKPILIDTVKAPFFQEMLARISSVIDPSKIKYIVSNHAEMDHSGCLPQMIDLIKPEKVFASKTAIAALQDHFHFVDQNITPINNNEYFTLGDIKLKCIETKMLHWPESMFTYCANDKILFSQDAFGMHLATSKFFNDDNDAGVVRYEAAKYFANILLPYSTLVSKLIANFAQFDLDCEFIAPDHGPVWRGKKNINYIIDLWQQWSKQAFYPKAIIMYDTMWGSTAKMAKAIADGIMLHNIEVKVLPLSSVHRSDVSTELLEAGAFLVGSPTINQEIFPTVADNLCYLRGLKIKNLVGQTFGSYGWGGEAINTLHHDLNKMGIELIAEPIKARYVPTDATITECINLGAVIAASLQKKLT